MSLKYHETLAGLHLCVGGIVPRHPLGTLPVFAHARLAGLHLCVGGYCTEVVTVLYRDTPLVQVCQIGRGAARAEDAQGTPTQSHISPSIL